jgi:deoxycytidylate deaminase
LGAYRPPGEGFDDCEASHAEMNALVQCKVPMEIHTIYSTTAPCAQCLKSLLNTSAVRIVYGEDYPGAAKSKDRWEKRGRIWEHVGEIHATSPKEKKIWPTESLLL